MTFDMENSGRVINAERRRRPGANFANFQLHVSRNYVCEKVRILAPRIRFGGFLIGEHCTIN